MLIDAPKSVGIMTKTPPHASPQKKAKDHMELWPEMTFVQKLSSSPSRKRQVVDDKSDVHTPPQRQKELWPHRSFTLRVDSSIPPKVIPYTHVRSFFLHAEELIKACEKVEVRIVSLHREKRKADAMQRVSEMRESRGDAAAAVVQDSLRDWVRSVPEKRLMDAMRKALNELKPYVYKRTKEDDVITEKEIEPQIKMLKAVAVFFAEHLKENKIGLVNVYGNAVNMIISARAFLGEERSDLVEDLWPAQVSRSDKWKNRQKVEGVVESAIGSLRKLSVEEMLGNTTPPTPRRV